MNTGPKRSRTRRTGINDKAPHLLLRAPNFVSGPGDLEANAAPLACEASALTTELTALQPFYFRHKNQLCKQHLLLCQIFYTGMREQSGLHQLSTDNSSIVSISSIYH
jgi:hypothetical protein